MIRRIRRHIRHQRLRRDALDLYSLLSGPGRGIPIIMVHPLDVMGLEFDVIDWPWPIPEAISFPGSISVRPATRCGHPYDHERDGA